MTTDKRMFSRIPFQAEVLVSTDEGRWTCKLLNISLKGAMIEKPLDWDGIEGEPAFLELKLGEDPDIVIRMDATIVHVEDTLVGLRSDLIDIDSITHLRRLIELNLGDPDLLRRELHALVH